MASFYFFLFLYPALLVAVALHEAGHALFARIAGYRATSLGLGTRRPFFRAVLPGGMIVFLCRDHLTFGTCWTITPELLPSRQSRALLFVGGGVANLLFAAGCFAAWRGVGGGVLLALFVINALLGILNLLPLRHRLPGSGGKQSVASDGLQAASLFLSRRHRAEPPDAELGFQSQWQDTGDTRTESYRLCLAAITALDAGDTEAATHYLAASQTLPGSDNAAHRRFVEGRIALASGDAITARVSLDAARAVYESQNAAGSVFLCDLHGLFLLTPSDSATAWETLSRSPLAKRTAIQTRLAATRLLLFRQNDPHGDAAIFETLLARYEAARRMDRDDVLDATVYRAVAAWREAQGDAAGARLARERTC